ncbi:MAG: hypothetical protein QOF61_1992 [Acidobacteriota bacterium]|nr:hypothetical protein [Acidobacteriota bacterium]
MGILAILFIIAAVIGIIAGMDQLVDSVRRKFTKKEATSHTELSEAQIDLIAQRITKILALDERGEIDEGADINKLKASEDELEAALRQMPSLDAESALHLAYAFSLSWDYQGRREDARKVLRDALERVLAQGQSAPADLQILVLDRASLLAIKQADCKEGEAYANKMSELGRETGRELVEATALQRLGRLRYLCCEFDQARDLLEESLIKFQNLKPADFDWRKIAWVQFDLGELEVDQGNFTVARDWLKKSLDSYQRSGLTDNNSEGTLRVNFAFVLHRLGDRQGARAQMTAAGKVLEHEGRQENYFRWYLHFCGRMAMSEGDLSRADKFFKDSLEIFYARKDGLGVVRSLLGFSCLAAMEGKYVKAARLLGAENSLRSGEVGLPQPPLDWKSEVELMESHARGALGQTAFDAARAKGMLMTLEEAVATTLSR